MIKKFFYASLIATAMMFATSAIGFAQTAQTRGKVTLQQADGTTVPVQGAFVDVYRTDISQKKPQTAKTNKKGEFVFAGLMIGATYTISTSAPNASPDVLANIIAGREDITIDLRPGDGKRLTLEEIKQGATPTVTTPTATTGTATTTPTATPTATQTATQKPTKPAKEDADAKKAREQYEKELAEVNAKNAKNTNANNVVQKSLKEGNDAYNAGIKSRSAKNDSDAIAKFATAAAKYDEGYSVDPDFLGSAPIMLTNKSAALVGSGIIHYNNAVSNKDAAARTAAMESAKKDFQGAYEAADKAVLLFKNVPATPASTDAKSSEGVKYNALAQRADSARLLVKADSSKAAMAVIAYQEYIAVETDAKKKAESQLVSADLALGAGDIDSAATQYKEILAREPNNLKVMSKLGFALTSSEDKVKVQEGVEYLQQFINAAPDSDTDKGYAKATLEELKNQQKIVPTKTAGKSVRKKG